MGGARTRRSFQIQTSTNDTTWTTIYITTTGTGGTQTINVTGSGRYVRMNGTVRATGYGYSLWEFQVYTGTGGPTASPTTARPADRPVTRSSRPTRATRTSGRTSTSSTRPRRPRPSRAGSTPIFTQQETNQFGPQRYAVLFKPGTYTADVNLGFFTQVAGLGMLARRREPQRPRPGRGVLVRRQRHPELLARRREPVGDPAGRRDRRAVGGLAGRAVPPDAPARRANQIQLWNGGDGWSSGGFMADTKIDGLVVSGSQQQWYSRNSEFGSWTGSVWNMVFQGVHGRAAARTSRTRRTPSSRRPRWCGRSRSCTSTAPATYRVFVPALRTNSTGTTWFGKTPAGASISLIAVLHRPAGHHRRDHQRGARARARTCCSRRASTTSTRPIQVTRAEHRRARPRPGHVHPGQRRRRDDGRRRRRRQGRRHPVRRRRDQLAGADGGRPGRLVAPTTPPTRSRCTTCSSASAAPGVGQATNSLRDQQRQRHRRPHVALARRPRRRRRLDRSTPPTPA